MLEEKNTPLYTVGYSSFSSAEELTEYLRGQGIQVVIDVRSTPYSSHFPQFDKENLAQTLKGVGMYYRNYAESFGARQENRAYYRDGRLDFEYYTGTGRFEEGLIKVENSIAQGYRVALMCAEKDPITCHRAIMIARVFHEAHYPVLHLRPDCPPETHAALEKRLIEQYFPAEEQFSLFAQPMSDEEKRRESYRRQNDKIGFREEQLR